MAAVAQTVERWFRKPKVGGSIPPCGSKFAGLAQLVERRSCKPLTGVQVLYLAPSVCEFTKKGEKP